MSEQNCGCRISVVSKMGPFGDYRESRIEYCPMHKAAPELVEALESCLDAEGWRPRVADSAMERAAAVLAKTKETK